MERELGGWGYLLHLLFVIYGDAMGIAAVLGWWLSSTCFLPARNWGGITILRYHWIDLFQGF